MKYRLLGATGVRTSALALGAMNFGKWGNPDHEDSVRIIHHALDSGVNTIDTADIYSNGESERIVGKALSGARRDEVVLATKFHGPMGDGPNQRGNSRYWIKQAIEGSLRRLQTDWIDIYQVHRPDPDCDIDETLGALSDLVHEGKIRYAGTSGFKAHEIVHAQWIAKDRGRERFVSEQAQYSMLVRTIEAYEVPACEKHNVGVLCWSPLAKGWLAGNYRTGSQPTSVRGQLRDSHRYDISRAENQRKLHATEALSDLADEIGVSLIHMAIAFVLRPPIVAAAIIGPRTLEHLESQLGAENLQLEDELLERIDQIVPPQHTVNQSDYFYSPTALD